MGATQTRQRIVVLDRGALQMFGPKVDASLLRIPQRLLIHHRHRRIELGLDARTLLALLCATGGLAAAISDLRLWQ